MPRYDLPHGGWVDIRDGAGLTNGDRKNMLRRAQREAQNDSDFEMGLAAQDIQAALMVESWSLELPVPSENLAVMDELPIPVANAIYNACRDEWGKSDPDFGVSPDPATPTTRSSDSAGS